MTFGIPEFIVLFMTLVNFIGGPSLIRPPDPTPPAVVTTVETGLDAWEAAYARPSQP